jgi:hypothetical protein
MIENSEVFGGQIEEEVFLTNEQEVQMNMSDTYHEEEIA